jgi:hypothetical protein
MRRLLAVLYCAALIAACVWLLVSGHGPSPFDCAKGMLLGFIGLIYSIFIKGDPWGDAGPGRLSKTKESNSKNRPAFGTWDEELDG